MGGRGSIGGKSSPNNSNKKVLSATKAAESEQQAAEQQSNAEASGQDNFVRSNDNAREIPKTQSMIDKEAQDAFNEWVSNESHIAFKLMKDFEYKQEVARRNGDKAALEKAKKDTAKAYKRYTAVEKFDNVLSEDIRKEYERTTGKTLTDDQWRRVKGHKHYR